MRANPLEETIDLGLIAFMAFIGWKVFQGLTTTKADNGQPMCSMSDMENNNCISGDGSSACGWWEYFTATSCYRGTPAGAGTPASTTASIVLDPANPASILTPVMTTPAGSPGQGIPMCKDTITGNIYPC